MYHVNVRYRVEYKKIGIFDGILAKPLFNRAIITKSKNSVFYEVKCIVGKDEVNVWKTSNLVEAREIMDLLLGNRGYIVLGDKRLTRSLLANSGILFKVLSKC